MTTPAEEGRPSEAEISTWSIDVVARAVAIASLALCAGAGAGYLVSHEPPPRSRPGAHASAPPNAGVAPSASATNAQEPPSRPRAGDAELALLAPLREGGTLEGFQVTEIDPVSKKGQLVLVCRKGSTVARLYVALRADADAGPAAPATAGRYAVFYGIEDDARAQGDALARALAKILEANAAAPAPKGLAPFAPE